MWQPIETAPKRERNETPRIDLWVRFRDGECRMADCYWDGEFWRSNCDTRLFDPVIATHWMAKPDPPSGSAST